MPRNRSAGVVIRDGKLLVIHRFNKRDEYYVFPGGGVEPGETPEQAAMREIAEETTVSVTVDRLLYHITWDTGEENYYYLCEYVSGEPALPADSEEAEQMKDGEQVYEPMWIDIDTVPSVTLYQLEIRDLFLEDYRNGFVQEVRELQIKLGERRRA